ncbi:WSC domain-containing protein-like protein 3 [Phlyctema vagabunda]|uniref:WSC domain-containing protein-like protein 3 n=1 Tax=Phlyctema vagabunda TaxID=108571 RepID=A0ABR4PTD8_9HELO
MHPATVGSAIFGILWKNTYGNKERWYAKPLVYTPPGRSQLVFIASSMNVIRTLDAVNGTLLASRTVQPPFLQSDLGCTDIPDYIGIIGTPIIDPNTNTAYFFSKGYKNGASNGGVANGIYNFYAVDIITLADKPGFPILIDGHNADNDPARYFIGGTVLQRPSLTMINGVVIGGFGGHCDLFNYTGMLVGVSTIPNVGVVSMFAMESSPGAPPVQSDIFIEKGGKSGIWQAGMGLATDGSRFYCTTGNGQGHANGDVPASGRTPLSTLDEVVASMGISSTGKITLSDYFEPFEYISMDAGDRDLGSGGVALLDPTVFKGTGISRMAVTIGKNAKAYIMNANNLGGFKQGSGGTDNIIQTIPAAGSVFGGAGSYPLEGGYIYFTPVGAPTVAYKIGLDGKGAPLFTLVGQSAATSAGRVGVGCPTVTTYKGQAGTGILWVTDVNAGLLAYQAVPVNGVLVPIQIPPTGGLNKFGRPAFGDGRLYVTDGNGNIICMGSPVALPLQCSQPVNFGDVAIGSTATQIVNCTTNIAITKINGCGTSDGTFQCDNSTLPQGPLAQGATFTFPVTWNLTQSSINDAQNASFGKVSPGSVGASLNIYTTNAVPKYSTILPISLSGKTVSKKAFLSISPPAVDLGGIVVGSDNSKSGRTAAVILSNIGVETLTFTGRAWTETLDLEDGPIEYTNITDDGDLGSGFSSSDLPEVGSTLTSGASVTIPILFLADATGAYSTFLQFWTNGGNGYILLSGSASTAPIANISISTVEGGWDYSEPVIMEFGNVLSGTTISRDIRICNEGGSALSISKSKPPIQQELLAPNHGVDLAEGMSIDVDDCALGAVSIVAATQGGAVNRLDHTVSDYWILNTDDINFGVHDVKITANIRTKQVGPLLANGSAEYLYLGCYYDGGGRQLQKQFNDPKNENGACQTTCFSKGYIFAATEYHTQCWCGNKPPAVAKFTADSLKKCAFSCPGDVSQACGGDGTFMSLYYDRTKYVPGPEAIPGDSSSSSTSASSLTATNTGSSTSSSSATSTTVLGTSSSTSTVTSSTVSGISGTSSTSAAGTSTTGTSSSSIAPSATPTGPSIVQSIGAFSFIGCYTEATTGKALTGKTLANDTMTIQICASVCSTFQYFGIEYHRECYCGNSLSAGSVPATTGATCSQVCMGNPLQYCGGNSRLQMYQKQSSSSSSTITTGSSASSSTSSSASTGTGSSSSTSISSSTSLSTSSGSSDTSSVSSSSSQTTSSTSSSTTMSISSSSTTSTASTSTDTSLESSSTATTSSLSATSSTTSTTPISSPSTTSTSSSSSTSTSSSTSSSTVPSTTSTTSSPTTTPPTTTMATTTMATSTRSSVTATLGFTSAGCFADPAAGPYAGHNMPKLFANDSMTPELCISSALARLSATPATTYRYVGVEYARECYAGSVAPTPQPASLTGPKACTMACKGNPSLKCGGSNQMNLYVATTATISGTGTTVWNSAPAVSTV